MGYSTLLTRSIDFDTYSTILYPAYPNELSRPLILSLIQMLWDRSEPNGYAHRMTANPLPNTPAHKVLMNVALGDHQVTNYQADVEARTIGAEIHSPVVYDGRWPNFDVAWNIPRIASYPFSGSAIVYWDGGPVATRVRRCEQRRHRHRRPAARQRAEHERRRPARPAARTGGGAADGLGLPAPGRAEPDHRHLPRPPLLRRRLHRAIGSSFVTRLSSLGPVAGDE